MIELRLDDIRFMTEQISTVGQIQIYSQYAFYATAIILVAYERFWNRKQQVSSYDSKETITNLVIIGGYLLAESAFLGWNYFILTPVQSLQFMNIPNTALSAILAIVVVDFVYYWEHRVMHVIKPFWALHLAHHSAKEFNLTAAFRLNWLAPAVSTFFLIPIVLLGFTPKIVLFAIAFGQMYQFWCHTKSIGKVRFLEGILNTPSAHRVHHGSNEIYLDKNFGGIFMIWDRLFGTYIAESETPKYGITSGFVSYNPIVLNFHGFYDYVRGKMAYRG